MKSILICLILILVPVSAAAESYLHLGMFSQHLKGRDHKNQTHNLLGLEVNDVLVSKFKNSYYKDTYSILKFRRRGVCRGKWCLGHAYGLFKGYQFGTYTGVVPMVMPIVSYNYNNVGLDITCILTEVCAVQFRMRLK